MLFKSLMLAFALTGASAGAALACDCGEGGSCAKADSCKCEVCKAGNFGGEGCECTAKKAACGCDADETKAEKANCDCPKCNKAEGASEGK